MSDQHPHSAGPVPGPWAVHGGAPGARDVVTGEAVALELRLARLPSRALALAVDLAAIAAIGTLVLLLVLVAAANTDDGLGAALMLVAVVGVLVGYPTLWETLTRGRSPGKMLLGLRVVRDDGGPVRFRHAFVRALVGLVVDFNPIAFGVVGVIVSLCSAKGKRVGDLLAGTVVVRERVPAAQSTALPMPPQLAGWASGLQVGMLPDPLALEIRQLLGRLGQLDPAVAGQLAARLSDEVSRVLGSGPPPGVDPYTHLHAVLAERRNRELARTGAAPNGWHPGAGQPARPQQPWVQQPPPPQPWVQQPPQQLWAPQQPHPSAQHPPPQQPWTQHSSMPQQPPQQPWTQQPSMPQPPPQQPWTQPPPPQPWTHAAPAAPQPAAPPAAAPPPPGPFAPPA